MRIVFFGTSHFSAEILDFLHSLPLEIAAIVTRTDKPQGRDLQMGMSPVKQRALINYPNIPLLQPEKASTDAFCEELKVFSADLFFVVAYGEILKTTILSLPSKACINVHTSLLPKYRGAAPMQRCLMAGETITGVTFMEMALKMDAGDILLQEKVCIPPEMNVSELEQALLLASQKRLLEFLSNFDSYYAKKTAQVESDVTFAPKIMPEDCWIDPVQSAEALHNRIRALSPAPGAYFKVQFGSQVKRLKILKSILHSESNPYAPGHLWVQDSSLYLATGRGFLELIQVQLEGKKSMPASEFLRGVPKQFSLVS
jgi:methionyl-tRNA formyltransferase